MKDDELEQFAHRFINLWQENFSKAIADGKIIESMMQAAGNMQQFYDNKSKVDKWTQSFTAAVSNPFESRAKQPGGGDDDERYAHLERRIAALEAGQAKTGTKNKPGGKK